MLKVSKFSLGSRKAVRTHEDIVESEHCYSLTITLNPYYNSLSMDDQYNKMSKELIAFFGEMAPSFQIAMSTPEYTVDHNLHWHNYIVMNNDPMVFQQNIKHYIRQHKTFGRMYKLKIVDEVTDRLLEYPFKDIQRTNSYSEALSARFNPQHYIFKPQANIIVNVNNDKEVIHNGIKYKYSCVKDYLEEMKNNINKIANII